MDDKQGRTPCPYNHTPFNFRDSDPVRPSLSEVEHFETSTLVDPSYIIHLIRQLLPHAAGVKYESQQDENNITSSKDNNPMERIQDKSSVTANRNTDITNNDPEAPGSCNHQGDVSQEISTNRENNQRHMQVEDDHGTSLAEDEFSSVERKNAHFRQEVGEMLDDTEHTESKVQEDLREEAGCVLWDLAANPDHAKFMVENHLLDVLLAMLSVLIPDRMREICLGIMGNLACHAVLERAMVATIGLVQMVVQQLFFEDSPTLSETCREVVLDTLLQIGEALSLTDKYSAQLASNKELFGLAGKVIRLSGKDEVGPPGITAVVLVANLLAEQEKLIDEVLYDANFLNNLLELLPSASDDPGARNALWSVLGRMFGILATSQEIGPSRRDLVSVLARHSVLIAEDLDDHRDDDNGEDDKRLFERANSVSFNKGFKSKISTVSKMVHLLNDWITLDEESSVQDLSRSVRTASKQLSCTIDSQ